MPIEIKELLVEINVSGEGQQQQKSGAEPDKNGQETVKDYIDQVLTIIDNRKER